MSDGAGPEGQSATVTSVVDANPQIVAYNVTLSISNIPTVQISGDNVTLRFSNQYVVMMDGKQSE